MYSKPNCVACRQTVRALDKLGVNYEYSDITTDEHAYNTVKELGFMSAPVIIALDDSGNILKSFSGYQPEKLQELV